MDLTFTRDAFYHAQAQRLERMLGGPDDDEAVQEDPEGPSFEEAVQQLAKVRRLCHLS